MAVKIKKDGRTILSGKNYTDHKIEVWESQERKCSDCGRYLSFDSAEFHHYASRGMGGCFRDDLDHRNRVLCGGPMGCHEKARFERIK